MSEVITKAVDALNEKMAGRPFEGSAKFMITGEGAVIIDENGAHAGDEETDVTLTADPDTFESILSGDLDATTAFMSGKLVVDGDMGLAMKLGSVLT